MARPTSSSSASHRFMPESLDRMLRRFAVRCAGLMVLALVVAAAVAVGSHAPTDPSWNTVSEGPIANLLGKPGAVLSDVLVQSIGVTCWGVVLVLVCWSVRWILIQPPKMILLRFGAMVLALPMLALPLTYLPWQAMAPGVVGWGGSLGSLMRFHIDPLLAVYLPNWAMATLAWGLLLPLALVLFAYASAIPARVWRWCSLKLWQAGCLLWRGLIAGVRLVNGRKATAEEDPLLPAETEVVPAPRKRRKAVPKSEAETAEDTDIVVDRVEKAESEEETKRARQGRLRLGRRMSGAYELPPLDLLAAPKAKAKVKGSDDGLAHNAQLLESVLKEFGVHGQIRNVHPGPVVTLYELEPAPGTKTSRVVGLADDIARSMSAVSARIAVIPGQNAIGIELPNAKRETVYLRELLTTDAFAKTQQNLSLALGKDIGGEPEFVDLARMPHLLIAGTTGSGKSVAVNTMILSLLYRLTPEQCRLIMIDPKMLELSVYDGIPHLLTPVVTDPGKAVVALKWAVREMEDRYRAMSLLGVRNIQGYNQKLEQLLKKGETVSRSVQTGFDPETGKPIYEEQELDLKAMPNIVVIVDEMADLMLVAGKDVEAAIQRLAQMARAAGIHLIMATQRPSVDVITGTIKANFPTRISFQVTSKIDSRTILGEQGAEQLLGQGDMLYMAAGGRINRIHGPFVSDQEVEDIVTFLRDQGEPDYIEAVTEDPDEEMSDDDGSADENLDPLYDQAVNIVLRDRKASTSYIQRQLQVGYNRAARMIETMERNGVVSPANRVGKREVFGGEPQP